MKTPGGPDAFPRRNNRLADLKTKLLRDRGDDDALDSLASRASRATVHMLIPVHRWLRLKGQTAGLRGLMICLASTFQVLDC